MAIINNTTGEYVVVESVNFTAQSVNVRKARNAAERANFKAGNINMYENSFYEEVPVNITTIPLADNTKSVKDNLIAYGYALLKANPGYSGYADA